MVELSEAREAIKPIEPALIKGLKTAAEKWQWLHEEKPELVVPLDTTTRAKFLHNHGCSEIALITAEVPNVRVAEHLDFFALHVGDDILLRVKFVGRGMPHNYPTQRQKELAKQQFSGDLMLSLDGITDAPTLLTCGYTLDTVDIDRIEIRRDCVGHLPWNYDIYGGEAIVEPLVIPGMTDTTKPAIVTSKRIAAEGETHAESA